mmetsp:Transcript_24202/g.62382  ORF Transcript_24202/g.62382 Transcript_24202/m.62382 type:complete len:179 (-) Transcript_24202:27-563(-)
MRPHPAHAVPAWHASALCARCQRPLGCPFPPMYAPRAPGRPRRARTAQQTVGWVFVLGGLAGTAGATFTGWRLHDQAVRERSAPVPARVEQPGGAVGVVWVEPAQAEGAKGFDRRRFALVHAAALVGLSAACALGVLVDEGRLVLYLGVGAGFALACAGWAGAWALVRDEHVAKAPPT